MFVLIWHWYNVGYISSDWFPLPLFSILHQLWHSCLEANWFLLPPQPPNTNGLHSPDRGWKYQSRTYSEQAPSDIGSRQWSAAGIACEVKDERVNNTPYKDAGHSLFPPLCQMLEKQKKFRKKVLVCLRSGIHDYTVPAWSLSLSGK